jgi:hypothetical protein
MTTRSALILRRSWSVAAAGMLVSVFALVAPAGAQRLGITPDEIDGGHTSALSRPKELASVSRRTESRSSATIRMLGRRAT